MQIKPSKLVDIELSPTSLKYLSRYLGYWVQGALVEVWGFLTISFMQYSDSHYCMTSSELATIVSTKVTGILVSIQLG